VTIDDNRAIVATLWRRLYDERDYEGVGALFAEDGRYVDMPAPDVGAVGPLQVAARLRLGLAPLTELNHDLEEMVAEGDTVVTEHIEHWRFPTGEQVSLPFVSVHRFRAGQIVQWRDYWNWDTLMSSVPQWWLDHIAQGYT
jgi:ketosteroid isomerase-like protein